MTPLDSPKDIRWLEQVCNNSGYKPPTMERSKYFYAVMYKSESCAYALMKVYSSISDAYKKVKRMIRADVANHLYDIAWDKSNPPKFTPQYKRNLFAHAMKKVVKTNHWTIHELTYSMQPLQAMPWNEILPGLDPKLWKEINETPDSD